MTDTRWHFGGPYGYEFDCQIIPPVAAGLASRLEAQAAAFLGQLETYRRLSNLPTLTNYAKDAAGNFYEFGFRMGRPYAVIHVIGAPEPPLNPLLGLSGIVFYHEALRGVTVYHQGIVARDSNGSRPDQYQQFNGSWLGYASKNKALFLGGSTAIDERLQFRPHSANWSQAFQVHVVTQLARISDDNDNGFMSRVFIGGVCVLQSNSVDFVGAQLYGDALLFAFIDMPDDSGNLVMGSRPLPAISYQEAFDYTPGPTFPVLTGDFSGAETVCNFHPARHEAQFIASKRSPADPVERTITLRMGHYTVADGWMVEESITDFKIVSSTPLLVATPITVVRNYVYTMDADGDYPQQAYSSWPNVTDDYSLEINIPPSSVEIVLDDFPVWAGYDAAGTRTVLRMDGTASASIGGTFACGYHMVQIGSTSFTETYDTPQCPATTYTADITLKVMKGGAGFETAARSVPFEHLAMSASKEGGPCIDGTNFVSGLCGIGAGDFIHAKMSRTSHYELITGYPCTKAVGASSLTGSTVTFNPSSNVNTATTFDLASVAPEYGFESTASKFNAYQRLANQKGVMVEEHGSAVPEVTISGYASSEGVLGPGKGIGTDPYTGSPVSGPGTVTRTITYTLNPTIRAIADVLNCAVVGNHLNRGCLYDSRLQKHIVSPWGVFASDLITATGNNTKRVYCVGSTSIDITPDFLTAAQNGVPVTPEIQPIGDLSTGDFFDPRGLL